ncbi:2-phospho-L-lactate guanylyltransferase [Herbiconiux sp. CPCC 203407]|uniref:Phosphoenolpyruvate guanylyltransferase n=1 Tax=Herbiconiux oxytropis TaxID=2970915 RepID=A0AA41XGC1_9MICO|nr:2-phospho-L-lactate guanylyltransferase [Herbiconiux oxytropis]MCS5722421.1 2-phospho-L-lactate guanylyltransferase [Herbiconiux oxytropis]MCS5725938.1 2-phospho-L-lactate guanylyltransferase [Herbiconiux oxytropis]
MTEEQRWSIVVPVKGTAEGKSRLAPELDAAARARLAEAFSLDAIAAVRAATRVHRVIVVTDATAPIAGHLRQQGIDLVDDPRGGLNPAVLAGLAAVGPAATARVAVLLGDLPCLVAADLDEALLGAEAHPLAFVPDAEGSGTTLVTAWPGHPLVPRFGAGSAERHRAAGHEELAVREGTTLRRDVDTAADLETARALGLGPRSHAAAIRAAAPPPSSRR